MPSHLPDSESAMQTTVGRRATPSKTPKRKGPGRPEGASSVREEILDAAERLFSGLGYAGTTLREVSQEAKVTQALINYYFGNKFGLFEEVFLRRGAEIARERMENLESLQAGGARPGVREIVQAFLLPTVILRTTLQGRHFLMLQARLHTEPPQISYGLRNKAYGDSTQRFVHALQDAMPGLSDLDANWRITMMIGTYLYAFSDTHRMEDRDAQYDPADWQSLIDQVTGFVVGGMSAGHSS